MVLIQSSYAAVLAAALAEVASASKEYPAHLLPRSPNALRQHLAKRSGTRPSGTLSKSQGCTRYHTVESGDTCYGLAEDWGISPWTNLLKWNTGLDEDCQELYVGYSYCMAVKSTTSSSATTSTSAAKCAATGSDSTSTSTTAKATATATDPITEDDEVEVTKCTSTATKTTSSAATKTASASYAFETRNGVFQEGVATWYYTGLGACGETNTDDQLIAAVPWEIFDNWPGASYNDPYNNPLCGKQLQARYGSKTVTATVKDRCGSCDGTHIDLTPSAFAKLADLDDGMIDVKWKWLKS